MTFKKIFLLILIFTILLSFNAVNALEDINSSDTVDQSIDLSMDDETTLNVEDNLDDETTLNVEDNLDDETTLNVEDNLDDENVKSNNDNVLRDESDNSSGENSPRVIYVGPNTGKGNGSYNNPFKNLEIANNAIIDGDGNGKEDNLIVKIFEGTYDFYYSLGFEVKPFGNLTMEPVSGKVIIKSRRNDNHITVGGLKNFWKYNNLIFDASKCNYDIKGETLKGEFYNCTFTGFNKNNLFGAYFGKNITFMNCKFINIDCPTESMFYNIWYEKLFKYCVFSANYSKFAKTFNDNAIFEDVWLGSNEIPSYFNITDSNKCIIKRHAIFSISENYINDTAYEIVGKLMWNDSTSDGIDQLGPMNVTLSSTTGELPGTAVLENGTFRVIYRSNSKDHTVTAKLDFEELELNFEIADIDVSVEDILVGQYANITVTLPDNSNGIVNVVVNNKTYTVNVTDSSSVNITVDEILNEGEYTVYATFKDEVNQVYGEASTNFTVSKIEDYQINIIAPSEAKIGDDVIITINLPIDATGNVTIQVNDDKQNLTIINGTASLTFTSLKEGTYSVIVNYEGDNKYDANENSTDFTVSKVETNNTDEVLNITTPIGTTTPTFSINLPADATGNLTVSVDGKNYTQALVNGSATVNVPALSAGNHNIVITYSGDDKYAPIIKNTTINIPKPKLAANDVTIYYNSGYKYKIRVTLNGVAVKGKKVTIKFNKKTYTLTTDKNGYAILKIDAKPGKYTITVTYNKVKVTKKVTVKSIVSAKNLKVKKSAKTLKIIISLKNVNKKYLKDKLTLKFNGKTYKAKINKKGVATFIIKKNVLKKLKVGKKYTYKVSYLKDSVNKKITVKK